MKKFVSPLSALFLSLVLMPARVTATDIIVWDFGPSTGLLTPPEGGSSAFGNLSSGQNYLDSVIFPTDTYISGYNLFTAGSRSENFDEQFLVLFWTDKNGGPFSVIGQMTMNASDVEFLGNYATTGGHMTDVYEISLRFAPILLHANTRYWVGASGLIFDMGTYGVVGPGDGGRMLMSGGIAVGWDNQFGDLAFQLVSVPEPSAFALFAAASALMLVRKSSKQVRSICATH